MALNTDFQWSAELDYLNCIYVFFIKNKFLLLYLSLVFNMSTTTKMYFLRKLHQTCNSMSGSINKNVHELKKVRV